MADFSLEGNIGAGKSTMLYMLQQEIPDLCVQDEPLDHIWVKVPIKDPLTGQEQHVNVFEAYCNDPHRYASSFQTLTFQTRRPYNNEIVVTPSIQERSILGDRIFGDVNYIMGNMDTIQYACYSYVVDNEMKRLRHPSKYIYLYCPATICHSRICKRSRNGESGIQLEYLQHIENLHNKHFLGNVNKLQYWIVDVSMDSNTPEYRSVVKAIASAMKGDVTALDQHTEEMKSVLIGV